MKGQLALLSIVALLHGIFVMTFAWQHIMRQAQLALVCQTLDTSLAIQVSC